MLSIAPKNSYVNFFKAYNKISGFVGKPTLQTNQLDWSCSDTASPSRMTYWVWGVCPGTANTINVEVSFEVTYYCKFYDKR